MTEMDIWLEIGTDIDRRMSEISWVDTNARQ